MGKLGFRNGIGKFIPSTDYLDPKLHASESWMIQNCKSNVLMEGWYFFNQALVTPKPLLVVNASLVTTGLSEL